MNFWEWVWFLAWAPVVVVFGLMTIAGFIGFIIASIHSHFAYRRMIRENRGPH